MRDKDVLPEQNLLKKAAAIKRFEYSPLGKELKAQTDIPKKHHQKLDNTFEFNKIIKKENQHLKLVSFYSALKNFNGLNQQKGRSKYKKVTVYDNASELYN